MCDTRWDGPQETTRVHITLVETVERVRLHQSEEQIETLLEVVRHHSLLTLMI